MGYSKEQLRSSLDIANTENKKANEPPCECDRIKICNKFFGRFRVSTKQTIKSLLLAYITSVLALKFLCLVGIGTIATSNILVVALFPCCGFSIVSFLIWRRVIEIYSEGLRVRILFRFWEIRWRDIMHVQQMDNGDIVLNTMIINEIILPQSIRKIPTLLECVRSHVGDEHVLTIFLMNKGLAISQYPRPTLVL